VSLEEFNQEFDLGKLALERGQYRQSIEHLKTAIDLISPNSDKGGDAQIWLVTAYQSNGMMEEAIALCQELSSHPSLNIRKQASNLLYILKAPRLQRPKKWLTEIPDLSQVSGSETQISAKNIPVKKPLKKTEEIDLSQVNTEDNQFVFIALIGILIIFASLFLFNLI
jgi:tetratricopeptide (TPR) repeat protein